MISASDNPVSSINVSGCLMVVCPLHESVQSVWGKGSVKETELTVKGGKSGTAQTWQHTGNTPTHGGRGTSLP